MVRSFCLLAILLAYAHTLARADEAEQLPAVESVRVGFGNTYKLGCWTPVEVVLDRPLGQGRGVEVQAPDGDSVPARYVDSSAASTGNRVFTYARIGRGEEPIDILLNRDNATKHGGLQTLRTLSSGKLPRALPATNEFIVELSSSIGLADLARRTKQDETDPGRTVIVTLDRPRRLPDQWYGYEGVDLVVISGTAEVKQFFADPKSVAALEHWVRLGGELLIACGSEAEQLFGNNKPLSRFAPGEFAEMMPLPFRGIPAIETFAGAEGTEERLNAEQLHVPLWRDLKGQVVLGLGERGNEIPLIVRCPLGFGQIIYVALDLHEPPFTEWPNRARLLERLLGRRSQRGGQPATQFDSSRGMQLGFVDLSGQLRGALDQFDDVGLIPFWAVAMLALAYVGILFPLNYWVATRWLKRPQLAWVGFLLVAGAFSIGAYAFAVGTKGDRLWVNQIDLVDVDVSTGSVRGSTWFNLFSPTNAKYDLQVRPSGFRVQGSGVRSQEAGGGNQPSPFSPGPQTGTTIQHSDQTPRHPDTQTPRHPNTHSLLSWLGLPGSGLGGMSSPAAAAPLFDEPYQIGAGQGRVTGVPVGIWSSKAFVARWQTAGGGIEADLTDVRGRLQGTITNRLDIPLDQCVILFGNWAWPIGTLAPGKTVPIESIDSQTSQTIETYLTKRRMFSSREEVPPYDRAGFDVARILEVMMFHEQAGGTNYTGLLHRHQRYVDLSSQLELGRAIIVGRAAFGAEVQIDGQPVAPEAMNSHTTVYRFVLPVKSRSREPSGT